jgi:PhoH-like ATPase
MARKKIYVLDTSVYLTDSGAINAFGIHDIVIPLKVLEEIDNHKKRQDSVGSNARRIIRTFDRLRSKGSICTGVRIGRGKGLISAANYDSSLLPKEWSLSDSDNQIIATAITEKKAQPNRKVVVVSRDINMRVKCDSIGMLCEGYESTRAVKEVSELYTGFKQHLCDDQVIDKFYDGGEVLLASSEVKLLPNHFVMLVSSSSEKKTALARFIAYDKPLQKIKNWKKGVWGVKARNKEQTFALDLLMDPSVSVVTLVGKAGSGKTLCAIAAGLEQVVEKSKEGSYKHLIVSRPIQPLGKDLGFLPGTLEEKMSPWLAPIQDNLRFLMGNDRTTLEQYMEQGIIEIEALTYIRGRSISDAFIIIDEAQNLTNHELKTIVTRVGENTKIILTGDIEQIDNAYVDATSNGLTHAVEKLKRFALTGHVTLVKGERSEVATLAAKYL